MNKFMAAFAVVLVCAQVAIPSFAKDLTSDEKLSDLNQMVSRLKSGYGPLQYKKKEVGIDIDVISAKYQNSVVATKSNSEFYYQILQFIAEFRDGHFSANVPSTHKATLPFTVDIIGGKVLLDVIDRAGLPEATFPYVKGDELVEMNGQPILDVVKHLQTFVSNGYVVSAQRVATMYLTNRVAARVPVPSNPDVTLKIRRGTSNIIDPVSMKWTYTGEAMDELGSGTSFMSHRLIPSQKRDFDLLSIRDDMALLERPEIEKSFRCSGTTRTQIPADATVIMSTPFVAYYHPTARGNIGYVRIPEYMATNPITGVSEFELRFAQYEYVVKILEEKTVGLVIDQQHNCGGSVDFLHQIATLFATAPFKPVQFELLSNKEEYLAFKGYADESQQFTVQYQNFLKVLNLIKTAWTNGDFMTIKTALNGEDMISPNEIHYTKPIIMMIDEMSGSGGDAFPALMQGIGRVKLVGERTMGLGGHVVEQPPLFYSQVKARITKSLFYRPSGVAIENNGAEPDIKYMPTRDDFLYGYRNQQDFVLAELYKMLDEAKPITK